MRLAAINQRLANLGGAKWDVHLRAKAMAEAGEDVILMTIGEPDVPTPDALRAVARASMDAGRTGYSDGRGEAGLLDALAALYSETRGRAIGPEHILCFPGTQTALYAALMGLVEAGDEVLVGDPMYATYAGVIRAPGADMVPVPLRPDAGFRMQAADIEARLTPRSRVIFLNTPHNPTGAILTPSDIEQIGALAVKHDLWILSDEVYEDMVFGEDQFTSPLSVLGLAERVIAVSSISKSHAAPGFRSGWLVGPPSFCEALLPLSETMLFGNQPFIADMTEHAVRQGSTVAKGMCARFSDRAQRLAGRLSDTPLTAHMPDAGMFAMVNVAGSGMDGTRFAETLLLQTGVAVMPGASFGDTMTDWVRVSLTTEDTAFDDALERIAGFVQ